MSSPTNPGRANTDAGAKPALMKGLASALNGTLQRPRALAVGEPDVVPLALEFPRWPEAAADWRMSYGKSANLVVGGDGKLSCAEAEVVRRLRGADYGAVWIDNFGSAPEAWRWASGNDRSLPQSVLVRHSGLKEWVRASTGKPGGCWDVVSWLGDDLIYIECKGPGDAIKPGQRAWRIAAEAIDPTTRWVLVEWRAS